MKPSCARLLGLLAALGLSAGPTLAGEDGDKPEFPKYDDVVDGYEKVTSTVDGSPGLYTLWVKEKDVEVLAELPADFESQRLFVHNVVSGGNPLAGVGILMSGDTYARWKRIGKQLALVEPEMLARTTGDVEDQKSHEVMYTDRVLLSVPIVTMSPKGGPVIDLDALLLKRSHEFFGPLTRGADTSLATLTKAKSFPENVEIAFELPLGDNPAGGNLLGGISLGGRRNAGRLTELHYSLSVLPEDTGYEPREADPRVGYFTTFFNDMSRTVTHDDTWVRYITRWHLEKADPDLRLSPPKEPIVWYIEHTTPIRYRRIIRDALLEWNTAFEAIGLVDAVEVRQQDARSGAYMDIDPEDVRYNFVRWNNNQASFAIGPSRADPMTGQIFDADLTLNAGIFASFARQLRAVLPGLAVEGMTAETMRWLDEHPEWDPRVLLAPPAERAALVAGRAAARAAGELPDYPEVVGLGTEIMADWPVLAPGDREGPGREVCLAGLYTALSNDLMRLAGLALAPEDADHGGHDRPGEPGEEDEADDEDVLDGLPADYVEAVMRWVVSHEAGHCLGLAHNFMASTIYDLEEVNSPDFPADRSIGGSVMEYAAPNINYGNSLGDVQGQWSIQFLGPYDMWAIDYGYGFHDDLDEVLAEATDPHHVYGTNSDQVGADPRVRTYDFGSDPLDFAASRMRMVRDLRQRIVDDFVEEGEGWGEARDAYTSLLSQHMLAVSIAANWVGGTYIHKDVKGAAERTPLEDVPAETQRRALRFVLDNTFHDDAFGLTPELLYHMNVDRWNDYGDEDLWDVDPAFSSHDLVSAVQSSALTMIMNPTTLRRVFDNELRIPAGEDALTLPELLDAVLWTAWAELEERPSGVFTAREPMISSLRRSLQDEVVDRLIVLGVGDGLTGSAERPLQSLARVRMGELAARIESVTSRMADRLDPYTASHLSDVHERLSRALEAQYVRDV